MFIPNAYLPRIAAATGLMEDSKYLDDLAAKAPISAIAEYHDAFVWWRDRLQSEARALFVEIDLLPKSDKGREILETQAHEMRHRSSFFGRALAQTGIRRA